MQKSIIIFFLCFAALLLSEISIAKISKPDSLRLAIKKAGIDSLKAPALYELAMYYNDEGNYNEALLKLNELLTLQKRRSNEVGTGQAYTALGLIYEKQGNYDNAIEFFFKGLKTWEKLGDKHNQISGFINIALIYLDMENYNEALKNCEKGLVIAKEVKDKIYLGYVYNTFGITYYYLGRQKEALKAHLNALKLREEVGSKPEIAATYNNLGIVYVELAEASKKSGNKKQANDYNMEAMKNYMGSLEILKEENDKAGIAMCNLNLGVLETKLKNNKKAQRLIEAGLKTFTEIGSREGLKESYKALYDLDSLNKRDKEAYFHYKMFIAYKDSLLSDENTRKVTQSQMQYDFDKKVAVQKEEQEKIDAVKDEELERQKTIRYAFTFGFGLVLLMIAAIYRSIKQKQKDNLLLAQKNEIIEQQKYQVEQKNEELNQQNEEISTQRDEIEKQKQMVDEAFEKLDEKNKEVIDSIKYASRIQRALLPNENYIDKQLTRLNK